MRAIESVTNGSPAYTGIGWPDQPQGTRPDVAAIPPLPRMEDDLYRQFFTEVDPSWTPRRVRVILGTHLDETPGRNVILEVQRLRKLGIPLRAQYDVGDVRAYAYTANHPDDPPQRSTPDEDGNPANLAPQYSPENTQPKEGEPYVRMRARELDERARNADINMEIHGHRNRGVWHFYAREAGRLALSLPRFLDNLASYARSKASNDGSASESDEEGRERRPAVWATIAHPNTLSGSRRNALGFDIGRRDGLTTDEEKAAYDDEIATYIIITAELLAAGYTPNYHPPDVNFNYAGCVSTEDAEERGLTKELDVGAALPRSVLTATDIYNTDPSAHCPMATGWIPGGYANGEMTGELVVLNCDWQMGGDLPICISGERKRRERPYLEPTGTGWPEGPAPELRSDQRRATRVVKIGGFCVSAPAVNNT